MLKNNKTNPLPTSLEVNQHRSESPVSVRVLIVNMRQWGIIFKVFVTFVLNVQNTLNSLFLLEVMFEKAAVWHLVVGITTDWPPTQCPPLFMDELSYEYNMLCSLHQEGCGFYSPRPGSVLQQTLATLSAGETLLLLEGFVSFSEAGHCSHFNSKSWMFWIKLDGKVFIQTHRQHDDILCWCLSSSGEHLVSQPLWNSESLIRSATWMRQTSPETLQTKVENGSRFGFRWATPFSVAFDCDLPMLLLTQK